jgi:MSHA biogenesis protein MshQ
MPYPVAAARGKISPGGFLWPYRKKITIDHIKVAGNLADYPMLVSLITDTDLAAHCQASGNDILFTLADGITKLSHQIEKFTKATGLLVAWVKIPALLAASDTIIYMYFGNKTCASQQDAVNVWDAGFAAVYHLSETSGHHLDSTVNAINTTVEVVTGKGTATGIANGGDDLNGMTDCLTASDNVLFDGGSGGHLSLEIWLNFDTKPSVKVADETLLRKPHSADPWNAWTWYVSSADDKPRLEFPTAIGGWRGVVFNTALNAATLYYLALSRNPDEAIWHRDFAYLNGASDGTEAADDGGVIFASDGALTIGANYSGGSGIDGEIDEIRISTVARTAQYFGTVYANLNSPSTFYTLGGLES